MVKVLLLLPLKTSFYHRQNRRIKLDVLRSGLPYSFITSYLFLYVRAKCGHHLGTRASNFPMIIKTKHSQKPNNHAGLRREHVSPYISCSTIFYSLLFLYPSYIFYFRIGQFAEERLRLFDIPDKSDISAVFERLSEYFRLNCL